MGELPPWYLLVRAARYAGVAPWELAEHSALWMHLLLSAESAENNAEAQRAEHARQSR